MKIPLINKYIISFKINKMSLSKIHLLIKSIHDKEFYLLMPSSVVNQLEKMSYEKLLMLSNKCELIYKLLDSFDNVDNNKKYDSLSTEELFEKNIDELLSMIND